MYPLRNCWILPESSVPFRKETMKFQINQNFKSLLFLSYSPLCNLFFDSNITKMAEFLKYQIPMSHQEWNKDASLKSYVDYYHKTGVILRSESSVVDIKFELPMGLEVFDFSFLKSSFPVNTAKAIL